MVQAAYVSAFLSLHGFRGASSFSTWITRIVLNEAYGRLRKANRALPAWGVPWGEKDGNLIMFPMMAMAAADPEQDTARAQVRQLLERAVDELPEPFRVVFVLRDVQELSIEETANVLGIKPQTVKTRLFRQGASCASGWRKTCRQPSPTSSRSTATAAQEWLKA